MIEKLIIMTQEEKQLLLEDLCTRLPYGVMIHYESGVSGDEMLASIDIEGYDIIINGSWSIKDVYRGLIERGLALEAPTGMYDI